jgi:hypothetical protein
MFLHGEKCDALIQKKTILKGFENHKLKYIMKYGFF